MPLTGQISAKLFRLFYYGLFRRPCFRLSVIVPNYNHANYLEERLRSVFSQRYPLHEIILLDDASTDGSLEMLQRYVAQYPAYNTSIVANRSNTGSPFLQWLKGVELARGEYVWIAESDDIAEPGFLQEVMKGFTDDNVVLSYCQSAQINETGQIIAEDCQEYVAEISTEKWKQYYTEEGSVECRSCLSIKNTIPNVSAVVFRKDILLKVLQDHVDELRNLVGTGDWLTYLHVLAHGKIAYSPRVLNQHRRHQDSVIYSNLDLSLFKEIVSLQDRARELYVPDRQTINKAEVYAQYLYEQLGLASPDRPS